MRLASLGLIAAACFPVAALARSPEISLLGMPFYSIGYIEVMAQLVALVAFLYATKRHKRREGWPFLRAVLLTTLKVVLVWELVWNADNLVTSLWVAGVCKFRGGVHIYRIVETDGFMSWSDVDRGLAHGFKFMEKRNWNHGGEPTYSRFSIVDGRKTEISIEQPKSRYQAVKVHKSSAYRIKERGTEVRDRKTGEILGERKYFLVGFGLFDSMILSILPGASSPWSVCRDKASTLVTESGEHLPISHWELVKAVLKPAHQGVVANENRGDL